MAYDRRQLMALCFTASLAPVTRLLPKLTARIAGSASWLAPLCALPTLLVMLALLTGLMKMRREGEGLGEVALRRAGRGVGTVALTIAAAFMVFNAGFILRTGAHRLISTIYPAAGPWVFVISMLLLGTAAVLGPTKALPRAGRVFAPVLAAVMLLTLAFSLSSVDLRNLLPVRRNEAGRLFIASLAVVEIYGGVLCAAAVLEHRAPLRSRRFLAYARWLLPIIALLTAFCTVIVGSYGAGLTAQFAHPFFSMIRDVTLLKTVERIEALVAALWVLSDFAVFTLLLAAATHLLRLVLGFKPDGGDEPMLSMANGRFIIPVCAVLALIVAALSPSGAQSMDTISYVVIPAMNLGICFVLIPLLLLTAKLRERRGG